MNITVKNFNSSGVDIELELNSKIVCFYGHSGSGKSSLLNMIHGIREYDGHCDVSHSIYMPQNFRLIDYLSVEDNIFLNMNHRNIDLMKHYLCEFQLERKIDANVNSMSGGERQRVCLIRSIMPLTRVLLLDEPTSALDRENTIKAAEILLKIKDNYDHIIIATHDMEFSDILGATRIHFENNRILKN